MKTSISESKLNVKQLTIQRSRNIQRKYKSREKYFVKKNSFSPCYEQLQNMNIMLCNRRGSNVLHDIATFEGREKCVILDKVLKLVKENKIPKASLVRAINTTNSCSETPLQKAIMLKLRKKQHSLLTLKDSTVVFCKKLLKNGANPECLQLPGINYSLRLYHNFLNNLARYKIFKINFKGNKKWSNSKNFANNWSI